MRKFLLVLLTVAVTWAVAAAESGGIYYYATWESALAQARRSQRPILLVAATPHCHNVSGLW